MTIQRVNWQAMTATQRQQLRTRLINLYQNRAWEAAYPELTAVAAEDIIRQPDNHVIIDLVGSRIDAAFVAGLRSQPVDAGLEWTAYVCLQPIIRATVTDKKALAKALLKFAIQQARAAGVTKVNLGLATGVVADWLTEAGIIGVERTVDGVTFIAFVEDAASAEAKL